MNLKILSFLQKLNILLLELQLILLYFLVEGLRSSNRNIPHAVYKEDPTESQMAFSINDMKTSINMVQITFEVDKSSN